MLAFNSIGLAYPASHQRWQTPMRRCFRRAIGSTQVSVYRGYTRVWLAPTFQSEAGISVNVGVPGHIKKLLLEGTDWTVKDVLTYAEIDTTGCDLLVGGHSIDLTNKVTDGQTVLLLRPARSNHRAYIKTDPASARPPELADNTGPSPVRKGVRTFLLSMAHINVSLMAWLGQIVVKFFMTALVLAVLFTWLPLLISRAAFGLRKPLEFLTKRIDQPKSQN